MEAPWGPKILKRSMSVAAGVGTIGDGVFAQLLGLAAVHEPRGLPRAFCRLARALHAKGDVCHESVAVDGALGDSIFSTRPARQTFLDQIPFVFCFRTAQECIPLNPLNQTHRTCLDAHKTV